LCCPHASNWDTDYIWKLDNSGTGGARILAVNRLHTNSELAFEIKNGVESQLCVTARIRNCLESLTAFSITLLENKLVDILKCKQYW